MTVRFHITFVACLASLLGGAPRLSAQVDLYIAHIADGGGFFSQISVYNPATSGTASCTFSTFNDTGNLLNLVYATSRAGSVASFRARAKVAATNPPQSSYTFTVPFGQTATFSTSGLGDGSSTPLSGGAELNCSSFVIGGVTYWYTTTEGDRITGIGVPAVNTTTAFLVDGGNQSTAFAFYNPSVLNTLQLTVEAYDGGTGIMVDSADITVAPNGHISFNAIDKLPNLPSDFYGSFRIPSNGQQFVPLVLGVAITNANTAGYVLYTIPSLSGEVVGID